MKLNWYANSFFPTESKDCMNIALFDDSKENFKTKLFIKHAISDFYTVYLNHEHWSLKYSVNAHVAYLVNIVYLKHWSFCLSAPSKNKYYECRG